MTDEIIVHVNNKRLVGWLQKAYELGCVGWKEMSEDAAKTLFQQCLLELQERPLEKKPQSAGDRYRYPQAQEALDTGQWAPYNATTPPAPKKFKKPTAGTNQETFTFPTANDLQYNPINNPPNYQT